MVATILEATFTIIILGLILAHAGPFSQVLTAVGDLYTGSVKALAGVAA